MICTDSDTNDSSYEVYAIASCTYEYLRITLVQIICDYYHCYYYLLLLMIILFDGFSGVSHDHHFNPYFLTFYSSSHVRAYKRTRTMPHGSS